MSDRIKRCISLLVVTIGFIAVGFVLLKNKNYNVISVLIAFFACIIFYFSYEKKETNIRRMVIVSVMTAFAAVGRIVFSVVPGFKPVAAIVILTGIFLGPEAGFLTGSLDAVISNMFFGQGPWTPFQMLAWGLTGMLAGLPGWNRALKKPLPLMLYGAFAGIMYSGVMDIWTVLSMDKCWRWSRFLAAQASALPFTIEYVVSNVIFLIILIKPVGEKMERLQTKYGLR